MKAIAPDQRFGRLVVLRVLESCGRGRRAETRCDCGKLHTALVYNLTNEGRGKTRSCGCLQSDIARAQHTKHGAEGTPEYVAWCHAISRCENPRSPRFKHYGGRGIRVCDEWRHDFAAFLAHVGPKPTPKHSLDRIDVNGNYEPGNVRWATPKEQANNTRRSLQVTVNGVAACSRDVLSHGVVAPSTFYGRLRRGWDAVAAATILPTRGKNRGRPRGVR